MPDMAVRHLGGQTFWMGADAVPRCALEAAVREVHLCLFTSLVVLGFGCYGCIVAATGTATGA